MSARLEPYPEELEKLSGTVRSPNSMPYIPTSTIPRRSQQEYRRLRRGFGCVVNVAGGDCIAQTEISYRAKRGDRAPDQHLNGCDPTARMMRGY